MARIVGRRTVPWLLSLIGFVVLAPLAVISPIGGAFGLAAMGGFVAILASRRARQLDQRCEKLSGEFDILSQRLVRLETVARLIADQQMRIERARADEAEPAPAQGKQAGNAAVEAAVEEVTAEIGLLSGIVRELAAVVATQDGEIARLKATPPAAPAPTPVVRPASRQAVLDAHVVPPPSPAFRNETGGTPWVPRAWPPLERSEPVTDRARPDRSRDAVMVAAFDGDGLEVHLQPIVSLPQRKVVSYEALARLRLGADILKPELFLPVLERHGRTTELDRRMLPLVATVARHLSGRGSQAAVTYALSPHSLFEPGFLRTLPRLLVGEPGLSGRLVIALPQSSWRSLDAEQAGALAELRGRVGFALDRPVDLRLDPLALADRGVSQVKVPADLLLRPDSRQAMPDIALDDLVASLSRAGIRLVAESVERESDVPDLIDLDVPLAQGTVFAPARAVRAEVLAAAPPQAAPSPAPPPSREPGGDDPEPPPQRRPFRDFLRRAG
ncbi:EAL domain-containing protein [Methylobacterium sp. Leaf106]|uniref:EAL domain-containing protein n=1 Tax=Methylobacterium sp. Leaf106 TaxID=1736255 RepID=UPI0007006DF4|nr:EAL domain-containing protein [Methylobacterium sp. Leaf106]KQP46971.1 diguanylate phosphodiesterase [Methylobacterium sp. Leaf106]